MNVLQLKKILNQSVLLSVDDKDNAIIIRESAEQSKIKTLRIHHAPSNCVAFTLDHVPATKNLRSCFKQLSCYFGSSGFQVNCYLH